MILTFGAQDKGTYQNAEFIIAVPTDITDVEKRAFYELFYKSKSKPKRSCSVRSLSLML